MTVIFKKQKAFSLLETIISLAMLTFIIVSITIFTARIFTIRRNYNAYINFDDNINVAVNIIKSDLDVANNITVISCTLTYDHNGIPTDANVTQTINYLEFTYLDSKITWMPLPRLRGLAKFVTPIGSNPTYTCDTMLTSDPSTIASPSTLIYRFPSNISLSNYLTNTPVFNLYSINLQNTSVDQLYLRVNLNFNSFIQGVSETKVINYLIKNQNAN